jgi:hypothetical protein
MQNAIQHTGLRELREFYLFWQIGRFFLSVFVNDLQICTTTLYDKRKLAVIFLLIVI